jgi:hypothetical protein
MFLLQSTIGFYHETLATKDRDASKEI